MYNVEIKALRDLAKDQNILFTEDELIECKDELLNVVYDMTQFDQVDTPSLPVKYKRKIESIAKIPQSENPLNAWFYKCDIQGAPHGKLKGRKIAVKDTIQIADVPLSYGSKLLNDFVPKEDATVVTRLLDAGGRIVGTTNCEEACISGNSITCAHGPVRNPYDHTRCSGGSSSGSAVVVATGEADMALGGDQGGSIRIPASWCGIVGLKPTHGLVPYTGIISGDPLVDHCGPMARSVSDCAVMLEVIAGIDNGLDPRQQTVLDIPEYSKHLSGTDYGNFRIGYVSEGFAICDKIVADAVLATKAVFERVGFTTEDVSVPMYTQAKTLRVGINLYDNLQTMKGIGYGMRGHKNLDLITHIEQKNSTNAPVEMTLYNRFEQLKFKYFEKYIGERYYAKSCNLIQLVRKNYDEALHKFDVLVLPTVPHVATKIPTEIDKMSLKEMRYICGSAAANTATFNFTGHPALTINAGFTKEGLPIGMMIVGKHLDEMTVFKVAYAFEQTAEANIRKEKFL